MIVAVVTSSRADFGIYRSLLGEFQRHPQIDLRLIVTGTHLSPEFGLTINEIEQGGWPVAHKVEMLLSSDSPEATAKSMGLALIGFAQLYAAHRPDWLVVLGDRFEMLSATAAALPFVFPIAHIHGGEVTIGAYDEVCRHSLTKMSHLHFASTEAYARRIVQLGEEPWRVMYTGALSLDGLGDIEEWSQERLSQKFAINLDEAPILVTFHPVTLHQDETLAQITELLAALKTVARPVVFTGSNADTGGRGVRSLIEQFVAGQQGRAWIVESFGRDAYFSMMKYAAVMVGNSSSGIIEAPSFGLPVVNIGERQKGRLRGANVIDADADQIAIIQAIHQALDPSFREICRSSPNPYAPPPGATAAAVICQRILSQEINPRLLEKRFFDL